MQNIKKILAFIVCFLLVITVVGCGKEEPSNNNNLRNDVNNVQNQMDGTANNSKNKVGKYVKPKESAFVWEYVDGGIAITEYTGTDKAVIVPDTLGGENVIEIRSGAFNTAAVLGIKLPNTMKEVTEKSFYYCTTLLEVYLGNATTSVAAQAFEGCIAVEMVNMNQGLEEIGKQSFGYCSHLTTVDIPSTTKKIGRGAFCLSGLKRVNIPASVEIIDESAFSTCLSLESVKIESGVKKIEREAFSRCEKLKNVEIPASVDSMGKRAFAQSNNIVISALADSVAEKYAVENEIAFKASGGR